MRSLREFFDSRSADRLMDRSACPSAIREFLRQEQIMLDSLAGSFDRLIEIGCMDGRYLEWAIAHRKRYIGIDIARRHVEQARQSLIARRLSPETYRFLHGDAENVDALLAPVADAHTRSLVFLPFNVFGAVGDVDRAMASLRRAGEPFLISSYQTTDSATACREEYYRRCGYDGLRMCRDLQGVSFVTSGGFRTTAYEADYLQALWRAHDVPVAAFAWSLLNIVYVPESFVTQILPDLCVSSPLTVTRRRVAPSPFFVS